MTIIDRFVANYISHAENDYIGLWMIASSLRENEGINSASEIKKNTLLIIKDLMKHNILPGYMIKGDGFNFWAGTQDEQLMRINAEWPKEGIPSLKTGDCWFALKK